MYFGFSWQCIRGPAWHECKKFPMNITISSSHPSTLHSISLSSPCDTYSWIIPLQTWNIATVTFLDHPDTYFLHVHVCIWTSWISDDDTNHVSHEHQDFFFASQQPLALFSNSIATPNQRKSGISHLWCFLSISDTLCQHLVYAGIHVFCVRNDGFSSDRLSPIKVY